MPNPTQAALLDARPADPDPVAAPPPTVVPKAKPLLDANEFEKRVQFRLQQLKANREAERRLDAEEHPPVALPSFETLRVRLARARQPATPRIEGWLPRNARMMLSAQFKAGKTTLAINIARSLLDSDPWLGVAPVTPIDGTLVVIDAEMSEGQLEDWYRPHVIRADDRLVLLSLRGRLSAFNILDRTVRAEWAARLKELEAGYVILDCLRPFLDAMNLDEQRDMGRFLVAYDALLVEAGILETTVIHHMGHDGDRARGDSRARDWPDAEWRLLRGKGKDPSAARSLVAYGRDVDQPQHALHYDKASRRLTLAEGDAPQEAKQDAKVKLVEEALMAVQALLADQPGLSKSQVQIAIVAQATHSRERVRAALDVGVARGTILCREALVQGQANRYFLPAPATSGA